MKPQDRLVEFANSSFRFWTCFFGGVGGRVGDDDDIVSQIPRTISPEEPFYLVRTVLSSCRAVLHSHQTYFLTLRIDLGISEGVLEIGWGKLLSEMISTP